MRGKVDFLLTGLLAKTLVEASSVDRIGSFWGDEGKGSFQIQVNLQEFSVLALCFFDTVFLKWYPFLPT